MCLCSKGIEVKSLKLNSVMNFTIFSNILSDPKNPLNSCSRTEVDSAPLVESADKTASTDIALRYVSSMQRVVFLLCFSFNGLIKFEGFKRRETQKENRKNRNHQKQWKNMRGTV